MCGLTKSVLLVLKYEEAGRDVAALKLGVHLLSLIDRYDRIVLTVKKYHWGGEPVSEIDRRAVVVKCAVGPEWLNEPVGVVQLELMRFSGQCNQVANSIVARTGSKFGVK